MTRRSFALLSALVAAILLQPRVAHAQQLEYFGQRADFAAASGDDLARLDFTELEDNSHFQTLAYPGLELRSTDGDPGDLMVISDELFPGLPALQSRVLLSNRNFNPLVLEVNPGVTAVGLDVMALLSGGGVEVIVDTTAGSQSYLVPLTDGGPTFVGFIARQGTITRVTVANVPGEAQFIAVDNVCYGNVPVPIGAALEALEEALAAGRADGSVCGLGSSLEDKLAAVRAAVEAEDLAAAGTALRCFDDHVRAQRGKKISADRADQLRTLAAELAALLAEAG
ncbi:MAG: hypothetical protein ACK47B_16055 [Armatimonadota bacterium]